MLVKRRFIEHKFLQLEFELYKCHNPKKKQNISPKNQYHWPQEEKDNLILSLLSMDSSKADKYVGRTTKLVFDVHLI